MKIRPGPWKSLSSELILVYTTLSIALVVLVTWIGYRMNARVLEERLRQELLLTVDQTLRGINAEIEERVREVQTLTQVPTLRDAARRATLRTERHGWQEADEEVVVAESARLSRFTVLDADVFLSELKETRSHLAEVFVTDRYGINAAASNPTSDLRQDDETWWQEAVGQHYFLSNLEYDDSAGSYAYSIALPIRDDPRPPIGVVKAVYNLKAIQQLANSVRIADGGYVVIVAPGGRVISHPRAEYLYRVTGDVPDLAPVAGLMARSLRGVGDFRRRTADGESSDWLVGYTRAMRPASLGPLNWTVAALVSRAEVLSPILSVRDSAVLAGLVFVLAAVPIVFAASRRLLRPLADLARRADRISQGDLEVSLAMPAGNEIGRLARGLSAMVENLKASHRRTLEINAGLEKTVRERTDELRRKNRQIEAQNKRVMEASRLKSQFLANMSHELRTPLNAVLALSEILGSEMSGPLNEEQVKQVAIINRSGKSLLRLINDVLDLSKIEAGRMSVERNPMSVPSLVTLVSDTLRPLAEDKSLSLTASIQEGVPEFIKSDEHKLRQILINLVGNGIKFTERGGVSLDVSYAEEPPAISFLIRDTGIGIAPEAIERVFEEFQQADGSTTRQYGGTGLGLTISKKMAELMGGTIVVQSAPAEGSAFTLTVPYEPAPPVPASPTETLRRVRMQVPEPALMNTGDDSATALRDARPIVLVAEDEQDNLYIMKKYLNKIGCQAVFARDGNEVVEKALTYMPIAITLDLVLPKKNGWDVLADLKSRPETRHIPVIIASVLDNRERGLCLGAYRYLVKPIDETDLSDTIHEILDAQRKDARRILIIDDSVVDSDLLERLLSESRYDVLKASRGDEGIQTAVRDRPDLIMLDLSMPGMDGFRVMKELKRREETRDIPVVISTAKDLTPEEARRLQEDARCVFLKSPLDPVTMLAEIGAIVRALPRADGTGGEAGESSEGAWGATVTALDAAVTASGRAATVASATEPQRSSRSSTQGRILIVEDDSANQYTLQFMLESEGYDVHVAENGREGIEKATQLRPDIVLMDMMMPVMGGHEATRTLKDTPGVMEIPVIALTAAAMAGDREKALAAGCDDYLSKPVNRDRLLQSVAAWVARARSSRQDAPPASPTDSLEKRLG